MSLGLDHSGSSAISADAIGAFGHDVRSPLNAITMLIDVARRVSNQEETLVLDEELTRMLLSSVDDIVRIVSELTEVSRLERGKASLRLAPVSLDDIVAATQATVEDTIQLSVTAPDTMPSGRWDEERLVAALAELTAAANRGGGASGQVSMSVESRPEAVHIEIWCGEESGEDRPVDATLGWPFYRAIALLKSMGATLDARRQRGYMHVAVELPAGTCAPAG